MNASDKIRELVATYISDPHKAEVVGFVDALLELASEVGSIGCRLENERALRFQIQEETEFDVVLIRAKTILRMACARLAVLCHESGDKDVSLYGGAGIIKKIMPFLTPRNSSAASRSVPAVVGAGGGLDHPPEPDGRESLCHERQVDWVVRFENTMSRQAFTIHQTTD